MGNAAGSAGPNQRMVSTTHSSYTNPYERSQPVHYYNATPRQSYGQVIPQPIAPTNEELVSDPRRGSMLSPAPDIGFRSDVLEPQEEVWVDPAQWDERRSMVFMRILSAEEFLGRMDETDEKIRTLSQVEEREMHLPRVTELMGLRGHLQDELLRIEAMLAEDDPDLLCLHEFEAEHDRVVGILRDIKERQKILNTVTIPLEPELISLNLVPSENSTQTANFSPQNDRSIGTQLGTNRATNMNSSVNVSTQSQSYPNSTNSVGQQCSTSTSTAAAGQIDVNEDLTEDGLKQLHDQVSLEQFDKDMTEFFSTQQEQKVAKNYAQRLLDSGKLTEEEMNRLLNNHLLSMQALRDKQNSERERLQAILEQKKKERLAARNKNDEGETFANSGSSIKRESIAVADSSDEENFEQLMSQFASKPSLKDDADFEDFETENTDKEQVNEGFVKRQQSLSDDLWKSLRNQSTPEDFHAMLASFRDQESNRKAIKAGEGDRHKAAMLAKLAARQNAKKRSSFSSDDDDTADTTRLDEKGISPQELREKDETFIRELKERRTDLSSDEVQALLKRHLEEVEALRRQRNSEGAKMYDKLQAKLAAKRAKHGDDYVNVDEEEKEMEEIDMDLDELDRALSASLVKGWSKMNEEEIQEILAKYRKQQEVLLKRKLNERERFSLKLEQKLKEKREQKQEKKNIEKMKDDEELFMKLQEMQKNGELTRESFNEILQVFLIKSQMPQPGAMKKRQMRKEENTAEARETASSLVQENEKAIQMMQNIRSREKSLFDSRLQSKLKAKNTRRLSVPAEDTES